jgi:hypothetical protein
MERQGVKKAGGQDMGKANDPDVGAAARRHHPAVGALFGPLVYPDAVQGPMGRSLQVGL